MLNILTKPYQFDKSYTVYSDGRVYSSLSGRFLKPGKVKGGYSFVSLPGRDGSRETCYLHVLVAQHWIPNPLGLPEVNHIDEDTSNNSLDNLEWCDRQYNIEYSQAKTFRFRNPNGEVVEVFNLQRFCRDNKLSAGNMHMVWSGQRNKHKGWVRYG